MRYFPLYVFLSVMLCSCCNNNNVSRLLDEVESYINERPDSALQVLKSVQESEVKGSRLRARYSLLYVMALDKNYIDLVSDSLLRPALNYYGRKGTSSEKMKSLFYQGVIQYNAKDYEQAIVTLSKAEKLALSIPDSLFLGMIYSTESVVYNKNYNSYEEYRYALKAYECYSDIGAEYKALTAKFTLGVSYQSLRRFDEAIAVYSELLPEFIALKDTILIADCLKSCAFASVFKDVPDPDRCIKMFEQAVNEYKSPLTAREYGCLAYAYSLNGDYHSADSILSQLSGFEESLYWGYMVNRLRGDYKTAIKQMEKANERQDSIVLVTLRESAVKALGTYYRLEAADSENKIVTLRLWLTSLALSIVIVVLIIIFVVRHYKEKYSTEMEQLLSIAESAKREKEIEHGLYEKQLFELRKKISLQHKSRFSLLKDLCEKYTFYDNKSDQQRFVREQIVPLLESIRKESGSHSDFEDLINKNLCNIMSKLRGDMRTFTENDFVLISYVIAGFDASLIARLMDMKKSDVYSRKHRLSVRILNAHTENSELYKDVFV